MKIFHVLWIALALLAGCANPARIAARVCDRLETSESLGVHSTQTVSFVKTFCVGDFVQSPQCAVASANALHVVVDINSTMYPSAFDTTFQKEGSHQPDLTISLGMVSGSPQLTERSWYPDENGEGMYREETYPTQHPSGVDELESEYSLFDTLPTNVCATAEFYRNWLGQESPQVNSWRRNIAEAQLVDVGYWIGKNRVYYNVYHLVREVYDTPRDNGGPGRQRRIDHYYVDLMTSRLVGWVSEYTDAVYSKKASYMVVERLYEYSN